MRAGVQSARAGGKAMTARTVVVTGGFGALGVAVAARALATGDKVAAIDFAAEPRAGTLAPEIIALGGVDLTDFDAASRAMQAAVDRTGRLDALINVAGGFVWQTLQDGGLEAWSRMFAMNLTTAVTASKAALPHLIRSGDGRIVNVGANAAAKAGAGMGAYAASKAAVAKLTESAAEELKSRGVTVNAVLPSIIDTPANRKDMPDADYAKWVTPDDLATVILFLASPQARAVTGALVPVTGGM
jgi:NAD(P)-dependent dehydrogenase (short-subunit alcohol dehydrogenase family)